MQGPSEEPLLPTLDLAKALGVDRGTVTYWHRKGCPSHRIPDARGRVRALAFKVSEVQAWREENVVPREEQLALMRAGANKANETRRLTALKDRALLVEDTKHVFGTFWFTAEEWRSAFQPMRGTPTNTADLVRGLLRAMEALGLELQTRIDGEGLTHYRMPAREAILEKTNGVLGPALHGEDLGDEGLL